MQIIRVLLKKTKICFFIKICILNFYNFIYIKNNIKDKKRKLKMQYLDNQSSKAYILIVKVFFYKSIWVMNLRLSVLIVE
jgi:hypothetical protein